MARHEDNARVTTLSIPEHHDTNNVGATADAPSPLKQKQSSPLNGRGGRYRELTRAALMLVVLERDFQLFLRIADVHTRRHFRVLVADVVGMSRAC